MSYNRKQADVAAAREERLAGSIRVAAVVKVLKFNPAQMTVDVQPLNKRQIDGQYASASPLMGVPVASICCGKYTIRPWYERGDVGTVIFCDADIDTALATGEEAEPNTQRSHAPEDGVFIGGLATGNTVPSGLPDNALILAAGSTYIAVTDGGVAVGGNLTVNGTLTAGGVALNGHTHTAPEGGGTTSGPH